jgi:hypothetical protein
VDPDSDSDPDPQLWKNDLNVPVKCKQQNFPFVGILKETDEKSRIRIRNLVVRIHNTAL